MPWKMPSQTCSVGTGRERGCSTPSIPLCVLPGDAKPRAGAPHGATSSFLPGGARGAPCPTPSTQQQQFPIQKGWGLYLQGHVCTTHHQDLGTAHSLGSLQDFSPACLGSRRSRDSAGEILSSVVSQDGLAERLRQGHSWGSGRHQTFPRQLAEPEQGCRMGMQLHSDLCSGSWSKGVRADGLQNHSKPPGSPR